MHPRAALDLLASRGLKEVVLGSLPPKTGTWVEGLRPTLAARQSHITQVGPLGLPKWLCTLWALGQVLARCHHATEARVQLRIGSNN